jgi:hypothetical protein
MQSAGGLFARLFNREPNLAEACRARALAGRGPPQPIWINVVSKVSLSAPQIKGFLEQGVLKTVSADPRTVQGAT